MKKKATYACGSNEHLFARRDVLGSMALGGVGAFALPAAAEQLASQQKRMLVINLKGGVSQLESWDPKPGTETGGPFRAIPTSVPGTHISELLPFTAKQMHHMSLVRGVNTKNNSHAPGTYMMLTGRRQMPGIAYPEIGSVVAKTLETEENTLPGHIKISANGSGARSADSAYLGPRFASMTIGGDKPLADSTRPTELTVEAAEMRDDFRSFANDSFALKRRTAQTDAYVQSFDQAQELMKQKDVFDLSLESDKDRERYGSHDFGRHCLMARRLLENDISFVQVSHTNYDTHNENFNFHLEQLGEFDLPFATLIGDLYDRGLIDSTLVVVLSEFGRTPKINVRYGRDHWGSAWSVALAGCGIAPGSVYGATNDGGTEVVDGEVDAGDLFHTYLCALGLKSSKSFQIGGRKYPMADPAHKPIRDILA
jgi:hypothetical protein